MALDVWLRMRRDVIKELEEKKEKIIKVCQNVRISRIAGGVAGVAGASVGIAGLALIPVTFGGSLVLTGIGLGVGVAGGVTGAGATIADIVVTQKELRKARVSLILDRQLCQVINSLMKSIEEIANRIVVEEPGVNKERVIAGICKGGQAAIRMSTVGVKIGVTTTEIVQMGGLAALEGTMFALRLTSVAAKCVVGVGIGVSAIILPLDFYEILYNSIKLAKKSPNAASKWLQEQIDLLKLQEEEIKKMQKEK